MADDSKDRTLWCGNLHGDTSEELLYELFVQAGPLEDVKIPTGKNFAFVSFSHVESVPYAMELMKGVTLIGHQLRMQFRPGSVHTDGGVRGGGNGYQQNTPRGNQQQGGRMAQQGHGGMGAGYNNRGGGYDNMGGGYTNIGGNPGAGMMASPNMAGGGGMGLVGMNFNTPLRPPMAGMLMNTGFHRSYSSPEFGNPRGGAPASLMGRQSSGGNGRYQQQQQQQQQQGGYGAGRDSPNSRGGSGGGGRDRDSYSQRHGGQQRSSSRDNSGRDNSGRDNRSSSHDRHGSSERKRRHDGDQDKSDSRGGAGRERDPQQRERDPQQIQKQASQNFRRQMASPPWKKSVAPWEQN